LKLYKISFCIADRRSNRRYYGRRGPPRPRQTQQDSQGEDKTEGTEGENVLLAKCCVFSTWLYIGEGSGEQIDRRRPRGPPRRRFRRFRRRGPRKDEEVLLCGMDRVDYSVLINVQGGGEENGERPPPRRRNYRPRNEEVSSVEHHRILDSLYVNEGIECM
jgi:hypothetical protein